MNMKVSPSLFYSLISLVLILIIPSCIKSVSNRVTELQSEELEAVGDTSAILAEFESSNVHFLTSAIEVRASFLLNKFRDTEDVIASAEGYQLQVIQHLTQTQNKLGLFEGDAELFAKLSNQYSELLAIELVLFWLNNPQSQNIKISIPLNQPIILEEIKDESY